jgi:hypothetical protein
MKLGEIIPLFAKSVFKTDINIEEKENIIIKNICNKKVFLNAIGTCSISEDVHILNSKKLNFLRKKLMSAVNIYMKDILKYKNDFIITTSWLTKTEKNQSSDLHYHSNSFFSGVFYIESDSKSDKIFFENLQGGSWLLEVNEFNIYNSRDLFLPVYKNLLILFPSDMLHKVGKNNNETPRISLAFNIIPIGEIGIRDSRLKIL